MLKATLLSAALGGAAEALHAGATAELSAPNGPHAEASRRHRSPARRSTDSPPAPPDSLQTQWTSGAKIWTTDARGRPGTSGFKEMMEGTSRFKEMMEGYQIFTYTSARVHEVEMGGMACLPKESVVWDKGAIELQGGTLNGISLVGGSVKVNDSLKSVTFRHISPGYVSGVMLSPADCEQHKQRWATVKDERVQVEKDLAGNGASILLKSGDVFRHLFTYTGTERPHFQFEDGEFSCLPADQVKWIPHAVAELISDGRHPELNGLSVGAGKAGKVGKVGLKDEVQSVIILHDTSEVLPNEVLIQSVALSDKDCETFEEMDEATKTAQKGPKTAQKGPKTH